MCNLVKLVMDEKVLCTVACVYTEERFDGNTLYFEMLDIDQQKIAEFELDADDFFIMREKKDQYTEVSVFAKL